MISPEIRAQVVESRRRQGLPDHITDPATLNRIVAILLETPTPEPDSAERAS